MNLLAIGCSFRDAPIDFRERVAFDDSKRDRALKELSARYGCESAILSTCNRVELYLAKPEGEGERPPESGLIAEFLAIFYGIAPAKVRPHLYGRALPAPPAVGHLFRVAASLDSLIVGEGQIAGQVRRSFVASALTLPPPGHCWNALFPHAVKAAKRARTETGILHRATFPFRASRSIT